MSKIMKQRQDVVEIWSNSVHFDGEELEVRKLSDLIPLVFRLMEIYGNDADIDIGEDWTIGYKTLETDFEYKKRLEYENHKKELEKKNEERKKKREENAKQKEYEKYLRLKEKYEKQ